MNKTYCWLLSLFVLGFGNGLFGAAESRSLLSEVPVVAQGEDVHSLSRTYCRALWSEIQARGYLMTTSAEFKGVFDRCVTELGRIIEKIKNFEPILIGAQLNLSDEPIADPDLLAFASYFDSGEYVSLKTALISMSVLGKHKGSVDLDIETNARVNEVFVYAWCKVKENPELLQEFLIGLVDAAQTCIQGYSVRMLCAVHPPKLKGVVKK